MTKRMWIGNHLIESIEGRDDIEKVLGCIEYRDDIAWRSFVGGKMVGESDNAKDARAIVIGAVDGETASKCKLCGSSGQEGRPVTCNREGCPQAKFRYAQPD